MRQNVENQDIRRMITEAGLFNWQVARKVGISTASMVVWLREPLPEGSERRNRILAALGETEGGTDGKRKTEGQ